MDVALDVTPLIGARSGVGHFVAEILDAMQGAPGMRLVPYSLSFRARPGGIPGLSAYPGGIAGSLAAIPAAIPCTATPFVTASTEIDVADLGL